MREIGRVILETLIVLVVGTGIALIANARANRSHHGLEMWRDYFKPVEKKTASSNGGLGSATKPVTQPATQEGTTTDIAKKVEKLIQDAGLTPLHYEEVAGMFNDPKHQNDAYVFVDARNDKYYKDGHIPRAWRLDHVNPELTLDAVKPFILGAEKIVVYCNGGECEDSLFTAGYLRDNLQVNPAAIHVYVGGFEEWRDKGEQVEKGERLSGEITTGGAK